MRDSTTDDNTLTHASDHKPTAESDAETNETNSAPENIEQNEPAHEAHHDSLHELNHLIEECNDIIEMLKEHHDLHHHESNAHVQHLINEIRANVMEMEDARHHAGISEKEQQAEFFNHHAEALRHANEHWLHLQHHVEILFEELEAEETEELRELKEHIKHLLTEIQREEAEKKNEAQHSAPHPKDAHDPRG